MLKVMRHPLEQVSGEVKRGFSESLVAASKGHVEEARRRMPDAAVANGLRKRSESGTVPIAVRSQNAMSSPRALFTLSTQVVVPSANSTQWRLGRLDDSDVTSGDHLADAAKGAIVEDGLRASAWSEARSLKSGDTQSESSGTTEPVSSASGCVGDSSLADVLPGRSRSEALNFPSSVVEANDDVCQERPLMPGAGMVPSVAGEASLNGDAASSHNSVPMEPAVAGIVGANQEGVRNSVGVAFGLSGQCLTEIVPNGTMMVNIGDRAVKLTSFPGASTSLTTALDSAEGDKVLTDKTSGRKQQATSSLEQTTGQSAPRGARPSDETNQGSNSFQEQSATAAVMGLADHAVAASAHAHDAAPSSATQIPPTVEGSRSTAAASASDGTYPELPTRDLPTPIINTAKLLQVLGQSEMRVGMKSSEFGNISISTSSTRDLISARIVLDHSELAKTLATHLLEMQETWSSDEGLDLRIGVNGQETGPSGGMFNGSGGESHGNQEQTERATPWHSSSGLTERQLSTSIPPVSAERGRLDERLDIRV